MATSVAALSIDTDDPDAWKRSAACKGVDTNIFHSDGAFLIEEAKGICLACPVVQDCLEYALPFDRMNSWGRGLGVYGGMDVEERRLFWRRLQRHSAPAYLARHANG